VILPAAWVLLACALPAACALRPVERRAPAVAVRLRPVHPLEAALRGLTLVELEAGPSRPARALRLHPDFSLGPELRCELNF
jgi:hypothetical protein